VGRCQLQYAGLLALTLTALYGCDATSPNASALQPQVLHDIRIVGGNNQTSATGQRLPLPLEVEALDQDGRPLANISVRFVVTQGEAVLSRAVDITDAQGRARSVLTFNSEPGTYRVSATAEGLIGLAPVFTLFAEGEPSESITPAGVLTDPEAPLIEPAMLHLEAADTMIVADGLAGTQLHALVTTADGEPVPFVTVDFSAAAGLLPTTQIQTDLNGRATVHWQGIASPVDIAAIAILAQAGDLRASTTLSLLGLEAILSTSADSIAADGNDQATIVLQLQDSRGAPLVDRVVEFSTTLGRLSAAKARTDALGRTQTILVASLEAGTATVEVSFGEDLMQSIPVVLAKGPPASIVVTGIDQPAISVQGTGADETAIISLEVRDSRGLPVGDGHPVFFRLDAPPEAGERVFPAITKTIAGRVQAAISGGTQARTVRLIALTLAANGDTIRSTPVPIAIRGSLPDQDHFSLAARPVNLAGQVLFGLESAITAFVFDQFSNPVPEGTSVRFRTDGGGVQASTAVNTNGQGSATLFTANPTPPGPSFLATITGQTVDRAGNEIEAATTVLFSGPTAPIRLTDDNAASVFGGNLSIEDGGFRIITFTVSDLDNNPLMGGSTIRASSDVAQVGGDAAVIIPDVRSGHTQYALVISDPQPAEDPPQAAQRGSVLIQVRSLNGDQQLTFGLTVD